MFPLSEWQALMGVNASAAATLTGLVFVAVSINLSKIIVYPGLPSRAAESIVQFLQVFFICTGMLVPRQTTTAAGIEILLIAAISWGSQAAWQVRYARSRSGHPKLWLIIRVVQTQLSSAPLFIGGVYLLLGEQAGVYWLWPGFLLSFAAGVGNAWVLLVEVVR